MAAYALMIAVTSTIASGAMFSSLLDISTTPAIVIAGVVVVLYRVTGGMWSVVVLVLLFARGLYSNAPIIWGPVSSLLVFVAVSLLPERGTAPGPAPRLTT